MLEFVRCGLACFRMFAKRVLRHYNLMLKLSDALLRYSRDLLRRCGCKKKKPKSQLYRRVVYELTAR